MLGSKFTIEYVRNEDHTATLQTAANVVQAFLATSMNCASCHDHFENDEWPQERFLAFAGMFAAKDLEKIRCELKTGTHVPAGVPFPLADLAGEVPQDLHGRLQLTVLAHGPCKSPLCQIDRQPAVEAILWPGIVRAGR